MATGIWRRRERATYWRLPKIVGGRSRWLTCQVRRAESNRMCFMLCADARLPQPADLSSTRRREALDGSMFEVGLQREPRRTDGATSEARTPSTAASETELASYVMGHMDALLEYDRGNCRLRTQVASAGIRTCACDRERTPSSPAENRT